LGAKRAGFKLAIQIQHNFKHGEIDEGAVPDLVITNMSQLLEILHCEKQSDQQSQPNLPVDNKIRAVLFDADGILYYRNNKDKEFSEFLCKLGVDYEEISEARILHIRHQASIGQITYEQYKAGILNLYGITDQNLVSRGIQISLAERDKIQFFNDTLETLNKLKNRNLYLGIVTDTSQPLYVKINKLERGGIGNLWDSIISSQEVGVQKPDPQIYQLALQQLGIKSDQAIFVGHKATELEGARNVGMKTVAFNYENDARADFYINNFSELADLPLVN
jgi:putative hydrolase of the HAD superfamily